MEGWDQNKCVRYEPDNQFPARKNYKWKRNPSTPVFSIIFHISLIAGIANANIYVFTSMFQDYKKNGFRLELLHIYFVFYFYLLYGTIYHYWKLRNMAPVHASGEPSGFYCHRCDDWKHPQSDHCKYCDKCVYKLAHHDYWLGRCIGSHNREHYILFLIYLFLFASLSFSICLWLFLEIYDDWLKRENLWTKNCQPSKCDLFSGIELVLVWLGLLTTSIAILKTEIEIASAISDIVQHGRFGKAEIERSDEELKFMTPVEKARLFFRLKERDSLIKLVMVPESRPPFDFWLDQMYQKVMRVY